MRRSPTLSLTPSTAINTEKEYDLRRARKALRAVNTLILGFQSAAAGQEVTRRVEKSTIVSNRRGEALTLTTRFFRPALLLFLILKNCIRRARLQRVYSEPTLKGC